MIQNLIDIFTAPSAVFARLKDKPTILFPLLVIILATASVQLGYIYLTDFGFLVDELVEQATATNANANEEQVRELYANLSPHTLAISGAVSSAILVTLILLLYSVYLNFVSKFSFVQLGWKAWMSLQCWTTLPSLLAVLASWVVILTSPNGQTSLTALSPLSIASLLGLEQTGPLAQLNLLSLWSFALLAMGYQQWTRKSMLASAFIALTPYVLLYGIWGALTM